MLAAEDPSLDGYSTVWHKSLLSAFLEKLGRNEGLFHLISCIPMFLSQAQKLYQIEPNNKQKIAAKQHVVLTNSTDCHKWKQSAFITKTGRKKQNITNVLPQKIFIISQKAKKFGHFPSTEEAKIKCKWLLGVTSRNWKRNLCFPNIFCLPPHPKCTFCIEIWKTAILLLHLFHLSNRNKCLKNTFWTNNTFGF